MFKKKRTIPAKPRPPTSDQISEDLSNATEDDVIFSVSPKMTYTGIKGDEKRIHTSEIEEAFLKARRIVHENRRLEEHISSSERKSAILKTNDAELRTITNDIKKQVEEALK